MPSCHTTTHRRSLGRHVSHPINSFPKSSSSFSLPADKGLDVTQLLASWHLCKLAVITHPPLCRPLQPQGPSLCSLVALGSFPVPAPAGPFPFLPAVQHPRSAKPECPGSAQACRLRPSPGAGAQLRQLRSSAPPSPLSVADAVLGPSPALPIDSPRRNTLSPPYR